MKVAILTVSDSCFSKSCKDESGLNIKELLLHNKELNASIEHYLIVPDDITQIKNALLEWCYKDINIILTTGGTGISPRDLTPEATKAVIEKEIPGIGLAMLTSSLKDVPTAMLSRPVCGIKNKTLIINLPGSKKGSQECLEVIIPILGHAIHLINNDIEEIKIHHLSISANIPLNKIPEFLDNDHYKKQDYPHQHHHHRQHHHQHDYHHSREHYKHHQELHTCNRELSLSHKSICDRPRMSGYSSISYEEALKIVIEQSNIHTSAESIDYMNTIGMVLAEDILVGEDFPPFPASIKDGYAVLASDGIGERKVIGASNAGIISDIEIIAGTCARINTGACVPKGADAVVMVEDTQLITSQDGEEIIIEILKIPSIGQDIRPIGSDQKSGDKLFSKGHRISASDLGLLVSLGIPQAVCHKKPLIGILSTGNELREINCKLLLGEIRDSNRPSLCSLLCQHSYSILDLGIARDCREEVAKYLNNGLSQVDVLISTGGVSMGDKDYVKDVLLELGADIHFGRVDIKPGKPVTFATLMYKGIKKLVFALPGNPVSCLVTCQLFVLPSLRALQADFNPYNSNIHAHLAHEIFLGDRPEFQRGRLRSDGSVENTGQQDSCKLGSMVGAQVLIQLPVKSSQLERLEKGTIVMCQILTPFF